MAFTHVLVPTDFSEPAHHALRYAIEEATLHRANVTLLHVLPPHTETAVSCAMAVPLLAPWLRRPTCQYDSEQRGLGIVSTVMSARRREVGASGRPRPM